MALPDFPRPLATVDVAIFSIREGRLCVLLVKRPSDTGEPFPGRWALPGGFVDVNRDRDLEACALRKLREKTGFAAPYLEQVGSWGNVKRDPRGWSVTHLYFALVQGTGELSPDSGASWRAVEGTSAGARLAFDHEQLLEAAITRLRAKVEYTSLPAHLVAEPFTLAELQRAFEVVLHRPVNKAAFRTRVLSSGMVEATGKQRDGPTRPAELYRLAHGRDEVTYFPRPFSPRD
jgi:8-oxo-dGTP diphosphatase